jgi:fumarate reductase (CoM/CoB) subunit B
MSIGSANRVLDKFSDECIQCGVCLNVCTLLNDLGLTPDEIAQAILKDQVNDELIAAIQRCDLCGHCSQDCLVNLNPSDMIKASRQILVQKGYISPEDYDVMLVDQDWNFFTIYRETYGIRYDDLASGAYSILFFPGCTLASYAPELTRAVFEWLKVQGYDVGFSDLCCGKPLDSIGLSEQEDRYLDRLRNQLSIAGATRIITACPNCDYHLKIRLPGIEIQSLYSILLGAGIRLSGDTTLTFHDSCPDRYDGKNGTEIRAILSGYEQVEMANWGKNTICCGSGGIVSMIDPELSIKRAQRRMAEFTATSANTCVTGCMACALRLARAGQPGQVRHCLEYVFDIPVDYSQIEENTRAMWKDNKGEINLYLMAHAHLVNEDRD